MTPPPNYSAIPAELQAIPNWVVFRAEWNEDRKKYNKPPFSVKTGQKADHQLPENRATFAEVLAAAPRYSGIGFSLTGTAYTGIDLDHCVENGVVADWAQIIINSFASYCELSYSGTGVHIIVKGKIGSSQGHKKGDIEVYSEGRYFVTTGSVIADGVSTIEDRQDELTAFVARVFPPETPKAKPAAAAPRMVSLPDGELLEKAMNAKNGAAFSRLWGGDTSAYDGDVSRGDLALCCGLAFWFGNDADAVDRLFRQSGRMRDKWDERRGECTYGERTITRALAITAATYSPPVPASQNKPRRLITSKDNPGETKTTPSANANASFSDDISAMIADALHGLPVSLSPDCMSLTLHENINAKDHEQVFRQLIGLRNRFEVLTKFLIADAYYQIGRDADGNKIKGARGLKKEWIEQNYPRLCQQIKKWALNTPKWPSNLRIREDERGYPVPWSWFDKNRDLSLEEKERIVREMRISTREGHKAAAEARKKTGMAALPRTLTDRLRRLIADRDEKFVDIMLRLAASGQLDDLICGEPSDNRETFPYSVYKDMGTFPAPDPDALAVSVCDDNSSSPPLQNAEKSSNLELFSEPEQRLPSPEMAVQALADNDFDAVFPPSFPIEESLREPWPKARMRCLRFVGADGPTIDLDGPASRLVAALRRLWDAEHSSCPRPRRTASNHRYGNDVRAG